MTTRGPGYDVVVLGGGPAGCVLASRLSEDPGRSVCLIEAGPDYGPYEDGRWPHDLLYANELAPSHDWGLAGGWSSWRAKVIGGCSSHNGCFIAWGSPDDFDEWAAAGDPAWSYAALEPYRRRCEVMLRARPSRVEDLEPFMRVGLDAAVEAGLPLLEDFDDPRELEGAAPIKVNAVGDVRWNAAFAYLDPARERSNLTIVPHAQVDGLRFHGERAAAVVVLLEGDEMEISSDLFVLTAGSYGSPAILLRSGVGPAEELARVSVGIRTDLPGVGRNLIDHPRVEVVHRPSAALLARSEEHLAGRPARAQTLIKARSEIASSSWDLHAMMRVRRPLANDTGRAPEDLLAHLYVHAMKPASRGIVRIGSSDPGVLPIVDPGFLTDEAGRDAATLVDGIRLLRRLASADAMRGLLDAELAPGQTAGDDEILDHVKRSVGGYWHPVGTCKMGPASDVDAVVDATGRLRGSENVYVADASIMPTIPRANTLLPVLVIAERIAGSLRER